MPEYPLIIQPEILFDIIDDENIVIIDVGSPKQYNEGHIKNAVNLPYSEFVVTRGDVEGAIADDEHIIEIFSKAGIDREKPIFVYDGTNNSRACRFIWTMHVMNHYNISLIDGGLGYWKSKGYPVTHEPHRNTSTIYIIEHGREAIADKNFVVENMLNSKNILLDTRSVEEYQGKKKIGKVKKAGHIPGAINLDWENFFDPKNHNRIVDEQTCKKLLLTNRLFSKKKKIVVYCQSHLRSSHTYVVLKSLGYKDVLGFEGSWSQWSADSSVEANVSESKPLYDRGQGSDPKNNILPLIITAEELDQKRQEKNILIVDLALPGIYKKGHIPNAVRLDYPSILYQHDNCDCDIPSEKELSRAMSVLGLRPEHHVVTYDRQGGAMATRFLWTLEALGHKNYSYLNGGLGIWSDSGFVVSEEDYFVESTNYIAKRQDECLIFKDDIIKKIDDPNTVFLDVRLEEEFTNELVMCDRGGYIPGAKNMDWEEAVDLDNHSVFKVDEELQKQLDEMGITQDKDVVVYCQTHARSAHTYYALRNLGYKNLVAYAAAYSEWGNDPDVPVENEYFGEDD